MDCGLGGWLLGERAGWIIELLGLLGLHGLLEGVFGFPALLEGGLNHVCPHARRSERSADDGERFCSDGFCGTVCFLSETEVWRRVAPN